MKDVLVPNTEYPRSSANYENQSIYYLFIFFIYDFKLCH